jgi:hypothetical protein
VVEGGGESGKWKEERRKKKEVEVDSWLWDERRRVEGWARV